MVIGAVPYVLLVFANMMPGYATFMPAFASVGFGAWLRLNVCMIWLTNSYCKNALDVTCVLRPSYHADSYRALC